MDDWIRILTLMNTLAVVYGLFLKIKWNKEKNKMDFLITLKTFRSINDEDEWFTKFKLEITNNSQINLFISRININQFLQVNLENLPSNEFKFSVPIDKKLIPEETYSTQYTANKFIENEIKLGEILVDIEVIDSVGNVYKSKTFSFTNFKIKI